MAKRILIADDDAELARLISHDLTRHGFEVSVAETGTEALRLGRAERWDLVLLDVMMPEIDGYHIAEELTKHLGDKCPKIIIITCRDVSKEQGVALMSGATAAIQKPIELPILRARVEEEIGKP